MADRRSKQRQAGQNKMVTGWGHSSDRQGVKTVTGMGVKQRQARDHNSGRQEVKTVTGRGKKNDRQGGQNNGRQRRNYSPQRSGDWHQAG